MKIQIVETIKGDIGVAIYAIARPDDHTVTAGKEVPDLLLDLRVMDHGDERDPDPGVELLQGCGRIEHDHAVMEIGDVVLAEPGKTTQEGERFLP